MAVRWESNFRGGRQNRISSNHGRTCAAVILNRNGDSMTKKCVESLISFAGPSLSQIILVDNGSENPNELDWADRFPNISVIRSSTNLGFAGGCNLGIQQAKPEHDIWLLNNDTLIFPDTLNALCSAFDHENVGAAGSVSNYVRPTQKIYPRIHTYDQLATYARIQRRDYQRCIREMRLSGFSMLIRREALNAVGLLDACFFPGGYEDDDYSLRLLDAGWSMEVCTGSVVYHIGSATLKQVSTVSESFSSNRSRLEEKWSIREDDLFDTSRYYLIVPEEMKWSSVLEIGAHGGCWLDNVITCAQPEIVDAIARAAVCTRFWNPRIGRITDPYCIPHSYDAIFLTDLPEEFFIRNPFIALTELLHSGGRIYLRGHSRQYYQHLQNTQESGFHLPPLIPETVLALAADAGLVQEEIRVVMKPNSDGTEYPQIIQICLRRKEDC